MLRLLVTSMLLGICLTAVGDDAPAVRWDFETAETLRTIQRGNVQHDQAGPRPPEFPDLSPENRAVRFGGDGYLAVAEPGEESHFDFTNGDSITLEAWVNPDHLRDSQPRYVIGKGRTGSPHVARDNQNWALRIVGEKGEAKVNFLFATEPSATDAHWHRWTSHQGFPPGTGWHHIAVTYTFGKPASIRGWINGIATEGRWDMGGATTRPPVVDDDEVRIGNGFLGGIDQVAVHRAILDDEELTARFRRVGEPRVPRLQAEVMPQLGEVPSGLVLIQLCHSLPAHDRWLYEGEPWPVEVARWQSDAFLLSRIPRHYDDWGIRSSWPAPLLLRMAADVDLPTGEHRFLLRARGLSRLWVDGQLVARTQPITGRPPDGEEPITPLAEPPLPGSRLPGYRQQEVFGAARIEADAAQPTRRCRVVLELVVGAKEHRTETGEVCVAIASADGSRFDVLGPQAAIPLTDAAVQPLLARLEQQLAQYEDEQRRAAAASRDGFWQKRHDAARAWAKANPAPKVPSGQQAAHPVDAFIEAKITSAVSAASAGELAQAEQFHQQVLPLLREHCFRCHGDKDQGGLKLNSRAAAVAGGDSEVPAVVPGHPEQSELIERITTDDGSRMPPTGAGLKPAEIETLTEWIRAGAHWPDPPLDPAEVALAPIVSDEAFLRRIYLDLVGVPPTAAEARRFLRDTSPTKRQQLIEDLLQDRRSADHWMSFWLDLLAENPSLLNASLNSTGPFRWFLYESLRDRKPLDRMVTELLLMRGDAAEGGSAGFAQAGENDAPFAEKGHIVATAFLGIELQCARCHDSPYHSTTQQDLYSLAAMLERKSVTVPATSRVPAAFFEKQHRESLIRATLGPDESVAARWPFAAATGVEDGTWVDKLMDQPEDSRERLAALITAPQNQRFARVVVNRLWKKLIGTGLVEPVHDWEGREPSHPELLDWLAHQLVTHNYDLQHVTEQIVASQLYQRQAVGHNQTASPERRFFNAPQRRRLSAEQIVDSLHVATGRQLDCEELTFVHDGRRPSGSRQTLGQPSRAWMLCDLKNERDRPSLSLPRARAVVDVLEAFGWTGSRQKPITQRETEPNVLQPGILANGTLTASLTQAAYESDLARAALQAQSPEALVEELFLRVLTREPTRQERQEFASALSAGFDTRRVPDENITPPSPLPALPLVTWFNHLREEANEIQVELEQRVLQGPPPDPRLDPQWRETYEDLVWSLINDRAFVWIP